MSGELFHVDSAPAVDPLAGLSPDRRRTVRQATLLRLGYHPLSLALPIKVAQHLRIHPEAAPADNRSAPGLRCGGCRYRLAGTYPKCVYARPARITHGAATDVRAWWPACQDWEAA